MQRSLRQIGLAVATVLTLTGALTMATTTAAGATPPDLSSVTAINAYLAANGITNAFWQTGLKNYAGPSCPGTGWNCHAANVPIVQFATLSDSTNLFLCLSPKCLVIQVAKVGGQNGGACLRKSADAVQVCEINQLINTGNPNSTNAAGIEQNIQQSQGSTQTARQVARITQVNGSGKNIAHIHQVIGQTSKVSGGSTTDQSQEAHQSGTVDQETESGSNTSNIDQSQKQSQKASGVTDLASQKQNTMVDTLTGFTCDRPEDDPAFDQQKNQCAEVLQNSSLLPGIGGIDDSDLRQLINEGQTVSGAGSLDQEQGQLSGLNGQDGTVEQNSSAPVDSHASQNTVQAQKATGVVVTFGDQFKNTGDPRCCQNQTDNLNSTADITQTTNQSASSDNAIQEAIFDGHCFSSGTCHVLQSATIDGSTDTNECPEPGDPPTGSCDEFMFCFEFTPEGGETEIQCVED